LFVPLILGRCFLKTSRALIDVHKGELTLRVGNEAITYNLDQSVRYSANYNQMTANKIDVIELACEEYSQEVLGFSNVTDNGIPTPQNDPIVSVTSPTLTPFGDSDFLLFEEADAFLGLEDDPDSLKINPFYYDPEGDILLLEAILNSKPSPLLPNQDQNLPSFKEELKAYEAQTVKLFVDEPSEVELKDLPHHLEYAFLEGDDKLPVIIAKELRNRSVSKPIGITKDVSFKVGVFHFPADFVVVDFEPDPRVSLILGRCFLKTSRALIDVHKGELTLRIGNEAITYNLDQTEADAFLGLEDDPDSPKINPFYYDPEGDILLLEAILNSEPSPPLPNQEQNLPSFKEELKAYEAQTVKSSVNEPPEVELKDLPHHLKYAFLEGDNKLPVIIAKELRSEEKAALIKVLKSHKRAIAWKLSDIQGINPKFCTHKILMEEDYKLTMQHQRWVNPKIHDVIKKEVEKLLDAGLIYPISDSPWVSSVHCVPKKGGFTVVENKENELILTRLVTGWRVCIDYRKLNEVTRKDHFPLPFMDQMLERLARNEYYCFLDGFSGYFQTPIDPRDQEKTTFTCPYG
nr:reverse transcriptase domain-containing protein [Tanacetum cinerariifolium]